MDLFQSEKIINLLPYDGEALYYSFIMNNADAEFYFDKLFNNINWEHDEVTIFGKHHITKRKVAWYGDNSCSYTYSGTTRHALPWTKELLELKNLVEEKSGNTFNACLLNLYHNGDEGMGWHSDDEKEIISQSSIASLSFGAERKFCFKHKQTKQQASCMLQNGSLLIMRGATQIHWLHSLPKSKKITAPRINLTFRLMKNFYS